MRLLTIFLFLTLNLLAQQTKYISKFELKQNDIELTCVAQPNQYFDKIGRKAALMGYESGNFEFWVWPWKVLNNFELQFFLGTSTQPIRAKDVVKRISVTPEATVLTYVYESFTVNQIFILPHDEQGLIILLDVFTTEPLTIIPGFTPVMQPQWPAGIGGQYSYWNDELNAYVISESKHRALFLCGSPAGGKMAQPPAHMFADSPLQFRLDVSPEDISEKYIPIIIAGGSELKQDSVQVLYNKLFRNAEKYYTANFEFYQDLGRSTIQIETPKPQLNLAFEWGKVALNNLLVTNPVLGTGLVAGYGLSGGGGRPGFAWYFGGDAFINSLAMTSYGDFSTVKQALTFVQKWQRQENFPIRKRSDAPENSDIGKMAHELSQSDGLIDWWNDYHYGYNHADTSPWYLVAMGNYIRASGDVKFLKESWASILQAYQWCQSKDTNGDGLMDLKGAGLGVLEFGKLVKIHNDIYTQGLWTQGLKEMITMAELMGDAPLKEILEKQFTQAQKSLEKIYWIDDLGYYSFGANEKGEQVREKSIWPASIIAFDLLDQEKSVKTIAAFNEADIVTDWGIRNLSNASSLYEPKNYNYGTVWPFTGMFMGTAQFQCGYDLEGWATIRNTYQHLFDDGLGVIPEVFSGDIDTKLAEAYHNQGFSISGFVYPVMKGLIGLEVDAVRNKITFSPQFPANWDNVNINNIRIGDQIVNLHYTLLDSVINLHIEKTGDNSIAFNFNPKLAFGSKVKSVIFNNTHHDFKLAENVRGKKVKMNLNIEDNSDLRISMKPGPGIYYPEIQSLIGSINVGLKLISQKYTNNNLEIITEGVAGKSYLLGMTNPELVSSVSGAEITGSHLKISFPGSEKHTFLRKVITLKLK
jgi:glycogen debranching enzyme